MWASIQTCNKVRKKSLISCEGSGNTEYKCSRVWLCPITALQCCSNLLLCFQCFILTFLILKGDVIYGGIHPSLLTFAADQELEPSANEICHTQHVATLGGCQAPTWHSPKAKQHQDQTGGAVGSSLVLQAADPIRPSNPDLVLSSLRGYRNNSLTPSYSNACEWKIKLYRKKNLGWGKCTNCSVSGLVILFWMRGEREGNMHVHFSKLLKFLFTGLPWVSQWIMIMVNLSVPVNSLQKTQSTKSCKILPSFSPVCTSWFSSEIYSNMEEIFRLSTSCWNITGK